MPVEWTEEQRQVIESRGTNLLVSAAAGSGKTAVLVERIIRMVTDPQHPIDIDKLLVMTFTNAAAAEMRERIGAAVTKRLEETPGDEHLQVQAALVHHAQITTIDSFCLNLIRDHFNCLDLDPAFRVGDEGELTLLRGDVMEKLLEDCYAADDGRFLRFVETYARGKSDYGIEEYIKQVCTFAQSNPFPDRWFAACREELALTEEAEFEHTAWMAFLLEDGRRQARELADQEEEALEVIRGDEYLNVYAPMFTQDVRLLRAVEEAEDFVRFQACLKEVAWDRLATVRSKEVDPEKKAYVTGCRDRVKKTVGKLKELYAYASPEELARDMAGTRETVETLLDLAEEYGRRYQEKKRERNLVDFNDLEHEALKVLTRWEDGKLCYTEAADELARQYAEVLVDEYQDSNLVQETLLHAVSAERFGRPDVFMVGDVKQSIYRFRLARPELFLDKYESYAPYGTDGKDGLKIELHRNFRSREEVLVGVNEIFYRIMTKNLGNIRYTEDAALYPGAKFAPDDGRVGGDVELLLVDTGSGALQQMEEDAADYTAREIEGKLIAARIREMTDPERGLRVWDKTLNEGAGGYRTARYRDMVILLRSTAGWVETLLAVLTGEGIPACAESRMGYFNTAEVETVLAILAVIDNPMQDIPLAAALKSPAAGLTDGELAEVMAHFKACAVKGQDRGLYAALRRYVEDFGEEDALANKLRAFLSLLADLRRESVYLPIHELICRVYERTGYYEYVSAMPAGETRRANLDMLVEKASAYEETSYRGLFHFIRYIENLKKYNTDFGEASTVGEEDDTVRLMSIHKSKGLEFPVVFLAGMGKRFNKQDSYGRLLIDPELGIAADCLDLERRLKTTTVKKNVLRRKLELDSLGEELRVLYVAMTRAKEKLIMTGTDRSLEKTMEKYAHVPLADGQIPYTVLTSAGSYLDWVLMAAGGGAQAVRIREIPLADVVGGELVRQARSRQSREELLAFDPGTVYDPEFAESLKKNLSGRYPYEQDLRLHTKMSVSELKKMGQGTDQEESVRLIPLPEGLREDTPPDGGYGATRGTAYHRALELLPFDKMGSAEDVARFLDDLTEQKHFSRDSRELVDAAVIWRFLDSPLGRRMSLAGREGRLYKERQFIMGIRAREISKDPHGSDELVVVQGIIDAYFEEAGGLVLVDYKTDKIRDAGELRERYGAQLDYYRQALERMTGKPVLEGLIYSLTLQEEVRCPLEKEHSS